MRISLRKVVTWTGIVFLFSIVSFNLYNSHVWLFTGPSRPWGMDFDTGQEHSAVHHPRFQASMRLGFNFNVTSPAEDSSHSTSRPTTKQWFIPSKSLWPNVDGYEDDRILKQIHFKINKSLENPRLKTILVYTGLRGWQIQKGQQTFFDKQCAINSCLLTDNKREAPTSDVILFHHTPVRPWTTRPPHQLWILFMLESPYHTPGLAGFGDVINMTATYRHDSDIVAPYEKFVPFDENVRTQHQNRSFAAGKTKQVAWFVSNCGARNGRREYADELAKYIPVDIFGACGPKKCPRKDANRCFDMLNKDYKFYLSFENSNCRDYITEKFFVTGLQHDVIPIVMGAAPEDYRRAAPPHSYIHVDEFDSPKELAEYLHLLDKNDYLYNEYFQWKGTGHFIDTLFWCRVCAMAHDKAHVPRSYQNLEEWWRGPDVCIGKDSWRKHPRISPYIQKESLTPST